MAGTYGSLLPRIKVYEGGRKVALGQQGWSGQRVRHEFGGLLCWKDRVVRTVFVAFRLPPVACGDGASKLVARGASDSHSPAFRSRRNAWRRQGGCVTVHVFDEVTNGCRHTICVLWHLSPTKKVLIWLL